MSQQGLFDISAVETTERDNFQLRFKALEIKTIELKMIDMNLRTRDDPPQKALTKEEREIYADYLEAVRNSPLGAKAFRDYAPETPKTKRSKKK